MAALKNVYIFLGPELGQRQDAVNAVKEKFKNAEESVFYPGETPVSAIADTILNGNLFAESRVIILKNAEQIKKKDELELIVSSINSMDDHTALIFLSDETKLASALDDAAPKSNKKIFYELFEREKNEWVRQFFKREGFDIDKDCITTILELTENNTDALKRECSRLISFIPKDKSITIEDIDRCLSHNREESAFTLFSRIASGDLSKALESMSVMLAAKQSAQSILAGLSWCFRKLTDYLNLLETGDAGSSFELKKIGLSSPKAKDDYAAASRRYSAEAAQSCLALTAEYDALLRSTVSVMENILMDRYIIAVFNNVKIK